MHASIDAKYVCLALSLQLSVCTQQCSMTTCQFLEIRNLIVYIFSRQNKIEHYRIQFEDNMYTLDRKKKFGCLTQLVENYKNHPITPLRVPVVNNRIPQYTVDDFKKSEY